MTWENILSDSEFQAQPDDVKMRVAKNYFKENFSADPEFKSLPSDQRMKVSFNFFKTIQKQETNGAWEGFVKPTLKAIPKVTGATVGSMALAPGAGIQGLSAMLPNANEPASFERGAKKFEEIMSFPSESLTPEERQGAENVGLAMKPFEWAGQAGAYVGRKADQGLQNLGLAPTALEPVMGAITEAALMFGLNGIPKTVKNIKSSDWYRTKTIKERAVVDSFVDNMAADIESGNMTVEQMREIMRGTDQAAKDALINKYVRGQETVTPEAPTVTPQATTETAQIPKVTVRNGRRGQVNVKPDENILTRQPDDVPDFDPEREALKAKVAPILQEVLQSKQIEVNPEVINTQNKIAEIEGIIQKNQAYKGAPIYSTWETALAENRQKLDDMINGRQPKEQSTVQTPEPQKAEDIQLPEIVEPTANMEGKQPILENFTTPDVINKGYRDISKKLGEKKAQKYFSQVDRLINPNENNIVEYRPNGVVTKEGEVYTFHALSGMDTKAWRVAFKNDVSEQFKGNKAQEGKGKPAPVSQKIPQETKPFLETPEGEYTLDLMSQELQAGEAGLTMEEADSGLMNVTGRFSSHSPWAKDIMKKHKVDSKYLDNIIQKHLDGKELTEKQFKIFGDIRRAANKMNYNIPEGLPTKEEVAKSKENYAFTQKKIKDEGYQEAQSVEAYNLSKGDKVIKNGEEFKVIGEEEGNLILKDGETVKVPLDETLYVNAVKKTEPRSEGGGQSALQAKPIPEPRIENTKAGKQVTIPGASEAETFSLANPETEWSKPLPKQQTVKTETLFDATSILNPEEIVNQLRGLKNNIKEAIPHLEKLGRSVYESGKTKYFDWQKQIKSYLGDMWERFKPRIQEIWKTVIKTIKIEKYFKNIKGILSNQRGSIGKGLTDDLKDILKDIGEVSDEYLGSISTRLGNIHPSIKNTMRKFEYTRGIKASERGKKVLPFLEKVKKMSKEDKEAFDLARKNGNPEELKRLVSKYNIGKEYHALKEVLSEMYNESVSVGYDVGYRFNYHPRVLKDSKGFLNYFYKHEKWPIINKAIKAKEAELKRLLTADEKAKLINSLLRGYPSNNIKLSRPGQLKERLVEVITPEVNEFYMDSDSALVHYINNVTDAIEAKRLFGGGEQTVKGFKPAIPIEDTIGGYVLKLLQEEKIMPDQEQVLTDILRARFNQVGTHGFVSAYKNLSYIDTMGSPISAVTQIGDLAWALYRNGFGKSLTSAGKAVFNKNKFTKEDLGVKRVASEFEDSTRTAKALEKVFKLTGLTKIDNIGKETLINSSYSKAVKLAKDNPEQLRKELKPIFEKETDQLVKDFQNGNVTDNVKLYLFNTLSDFQPISLSEMPQKYLSAGNGRIFYMLKTFTLKQFDVFRREAFQKIATPGTRLQGMKNLIWLTACFVFANATADEIKDLMLNRETEINDRVIDNLFRLGGVSKFVAWQARREGLRSAVVKQIAPPAKAPDAFLKDITQAGDGKGLELTQSIPIFGKFYYWWLGKGAEKTDKLDDLDGLNKLKE